MSAAIVPEVLLSSTYELAFDHYEHLLKRLRPTNVNEEAIDEGELPRIIRVLIVHSSFDMFRFRRNRKLGTIDPEVCRQRSRPQFTDVILLRTSCWMHVAISMLPSDAMRVFASSSVSETRSSMVTIHFKHV